MNKYIEDMDNQMKYIKDIVKYMRDTLSIISTIPESFSDIKDLIERSCLLIKSEITFYEFDSMKMKLLVKHQIKARIDMSPILSKRDKRYIPSTSSKGVQTIDLTQPSKTFSDGAYVSQNVFQKSPPGQNTFENIFHKIPVQQNPVEQQGSKRRELYEQKIPAQ